MMDPKDERPVNEPPPDDHIIVSYDGLNRIVVPFTVVHGDVLLLRRRISRGKVMASDDLLHSLAQMEQATRASAAELSALNNAEARHLSTGEKD